MHRNVVKYGIGRKIQVLIKAKKVHFFLTLASVAGERSASRSAALPPRKSPRYPLDTRLGGPMGIRHNTETGTPTLRSVVECHCYLSQKLCVRNDSDVPLLSQSEAMCMQWQWCAILLSQSEAICMLWQCCASLLFQSEDKCIQWQSYAILLSQSEAMCTQWQCCAILLSQSGAMCAWVPFCCLSQRMDAIKSERTKVVF
jgi:hypothetical protein